MNQPEATLDLLERGYQERTHWMARLQVDPRLDPLHEHPKFVRLRELMAFP